MYAVERLGNYISRGVYSVSAPFHPFGGAVDIIVVQQQDGSFKSSPWYVKFGKFQGVLKRKEKVVTISVNGVEADFYMYLDHKGEAYFLKELDGEGGDSVVYYPLSSGDEIDEQSQNGRTKKFESGDCDADQSNLVTQTDVGNGKIVARTNSRRSRIFGLMFGRKSMRDSRRGEGAGADLERVNSLERAEIAADLLEVNWSTSLRTNRPRMDNASRLSASNIPAEEAAKDLQVNDEQSLGSLLLNNNMGNRFDYPVLHEATGRCDGEMGNNSESGLRNTECSDEVTSPKARCLRSQEQDIEISTLEASVLEEMCKVISERSTEINKFDMGNAVFYERKRGSVSEITIPYLQNPHLTELEEGPGMQSETEQASDERNGHLNAGVSEKGSGGEGFSSSIYCGTLESSRVGVDVSSEQALETLNFSHEECERAELFSVVDIHLVTSDSVETEILEVIHQETITEKLIQDNSLETEPVQVFENQSRITGFSYSCTLGNSEVGLGEPSVASGSHVQMARVEQILGLVKETESQGVCISSCLSNSIHQDQEEENLGEVNEMNTLHPSLDFVGDPQGLRIDYLPTKVTNSSIPPAESSEEDQFPFSNISDFISSAVQCKETEKHPSVNLDDSEDKHKLNNINHESSSFSDKLVQDCLLNAFKPLLEVSRTTSSPMSIPRSRKGAVEEVERMIESLPNIRSHIGNLETSDVFYPVSHSLDLSSENSKCGFPRKDISSSLNSDSDSEHQLVKEHPTIEDIRSSEELKNMSINPAVEMSLCKHLLYEGMGADAASQAFDDEKVDVEKTVSLGPELVKNDRLVVRIGGHYFPWDAAAPIILGMVSFGHEQIFEPKGIIAVDQVEKTIEADPSRAIGPSGGSWRLWPFKKSTTMSSVRQAPDGTKGSDAENASESISEMSVDINVNKSTVSKKKVRSIVPTSEQLATLNLKEGQNVITFTFSTAMLGKQQVDARIYLWKWNTRIVVSDVDGTITKSDVLGQFMPLVGKDWSQTGVAHLFSAIKENGYQLLFLSARAISQAYLTRQFLFNLKQDGKALPDGPVVISPDGLFPSIIREVIRRAPHEFKIACLEDIRALFPPDRNPFYAGFGNRHTDEISYLKVGIPRGKIFTINPKGEVAVNHRVDTKSYTSLHALVNGMFPAMSSAEQEEFNSWNFWKMPLPDINI